MPKLTFTRHSDSICIYASNALPTSIFPENHRKSHPYHIAFCIHYSSILNKPLI